MTLELKLSIYASIVSTLVAFRDFWIYWNDRPKLKIKIFEGFVVNQKQTNTAIVLEKSDWNNFKTVNPNIPGCEPNIIFSISNISRRPVVLVNWSIVFKDKGGGGLSGLLQGIKPFSEKINEGESNTLWLPKQMLSAEIQKRTGIPKYILFKTATGKKFKSKKIADILNLSKIK